MHTTVLHGPLVLLLRAYRYYLQMVYALLANQIYWIHFGMLKSGLGIYRPATDYSEWLVKDSREADKIVFTG